MNWHPYPEGSSIPQLARIKTNCLFCGDKATRCFRHERERGLRRPEGGHFDIVEARACESEKCGASAEKYVKTMARYA